MRWASFRETPDRKNIGGTCSAKIIEHRQGRKFVGPPLVLSSRTSTDEVEVLLLDGLLNKAVSRVTNESHAHAVLQLRNHGRERAELSHSKNSTVSATT